jgi:hypothetical protein
VQHAGDKAAHSSNADFVTVLKNSCWPSRTLEKNKSEFSTENIRKIHLTRSSVRTLLFCCKAAASAFAPSSPNWFSFCKTHVGPHARRRKSNRAFSTENIRKNSYYKLQRLHAAVPL